MKIKNRICLCLLLIVGWTSVVHAKVNIVATTPDLGALASEIGKDKVKVTSIAKPTEDPHFVDAKPSFVVKLNKADMLIEVGMQLEIGWLPNLVLGARNQRILTGKPGYVLASNGIIPLEIPDSSVDRSMGDVHIMGNPHYTLDPLNGGIVATHICEQLCQIDVANSNYYQENLKQFTKQLELKLSEWKKMMEPFRGTKIVTYHKTFSYFAKRFNLNVVGTLEPKPGIPPSPSHLKEIMESIKNEGVKLVIISSFREHRSPEFVVGNTGAKVLSLPIMPGGQKEIKSYTDVFDYDINEIVNALKSMTK